MLKIPPNAPVHVPLGVHGRAVGPECGCHRLSRAQISSEGFSVCFTRSGFDLNKVLETRVRVVHVSRDRLSRIKVTHPAWERRRGSHDPL